MKRIQKYFINNKPLLFGLLLIMAVLCVGLYRNYRLSNYGIITVARVDKFEGAEQGVNVHITIFFQEKQFNCVVDSWCLRCEGKFYFIKIDKENPRSCGRVHLYENKAVSECLLRNIPYE